MKMLMPKLAVVLSVWSWFGTASVQAGDPQECWGIVLSDEAPGYLITRMVQAGYGSYNLYDALMSLQIGSDPSVAGVITDNFLDTLARCPAGSAIFKDRMKDCVGGAFAINADGTVEARDIRGATYDGQPEATTLVSMLVCVSWMRLTYTKNSNVPLTSWQGTGPSGEATTYKVFAVVWAGPGLPAQQGSGDLNWDGRTDVVDAVALSCLLAGKPGGFGCETAVDMNLDNTVNQLDLSALARLLAGS